MDDMAKEKSKAKGWKTVVGLAVIGIAEIVSVVGFPDIGEPLKTVGMILSGVGLGHKMVKLGK